MTIKKFLTFWLMVALAAGAAADSVDGLGALQEDWARANYELGKDDQKKAFQELEQRVDDLVIQNPGRVEPVIWKAIILSTEAGVVGGLGALSKAKEARDLLLKAAEQDGSALNGSVYTSLGSLYYKVPGWPIGFGDKEKAEGYLKKALAANPDGIDPNYFYADFLYESKKYGDALKYAEHALAAAPRPDRPVADAGRRDEINELISRLHQKLGLASSS